MSDSPGTPILPARDTRLGPEAVAERQFTRAKRGYAEVEVRAFLRMVSDELMASRSRERDLQARVHELEERLARPAAPPSEQDLITALGEETARVLRQAREAAVDLRTKAQEHARRVVREAQESARELRHSTQQAVEAKTREAEDAARARAREIVGEARSLRERILADLQERRTELEGQIGELRSGRGRLVEVYELVERALAEATRVMAEEPAPPPPAGPAARETPEGAEQGDEDLLPSAPVADARMEEERGQPTAPSGEARDVGALFEKLRSETEAVAAPASSQEPGAAAGAEPAEGASTAREPAGSTEASPVPDTDEVGLLPEETPLAGAAPAAATLDSGAVDEPADAVGRVALASRDAALAPTADDLGRRARRALQDEQNEILDGLRRRRGRIDVAKILPPPDDQLGRWAHVLQPSVDAAYTAGAATVGATDGAGSRAVPAGLLSELAAGVVAPLRRRLEASLESVDARTQTDEELAVAQRLGARYREWRGQDLDEVLGDALAIAFTRGVYDAAPAGARLRWVPARVGKCPDCDDNALEPTVRGEDFPTGQPHPPAHPGCRCLLVLATED